MQCVSLFSALSIQGVVMHNARLCEDALMYEAELEIAKLAVREACDICRTVRKDMESEDTATKDDRSPVTVADLGGQAIMSHMLHEAYPSDPLMAEEDTEMLRDPANEDLLARVVEQVQSRNADLDTEAVLAAIARGGYEGGPTGRFWTMDPVDGTKGYIRGDQYAVALALIDNGEVVLGVLGCPNLPARFGDEGSPSGILFWAMAGSGATMEWLDDKGEAPILVSGIEDATQAVFCQSYESAHTSHSRADQISELLGVIVEPLRLDSQCKYGVVARGESGVYMRLPSSADYEENIWDHAAGWIVVMEAEGEVTDVDGKQLDFTLGRTLKANRGVIATNGYLHEPVLDAVRNVLGKT
jgi:3'(2'), 5'-bisphosphate nucleotidase